MSTIKEQARQEKEVITSQVINKALDETKDNIRRTTDEARKDIPRYTQIVNEYQEETIQAARQMADNYLECQREIINSLQSAMVPPIDNKRNTYSSKKDGLLFLYRWLFFFKVTL
jgi:vacuolar-type H+-ATPase subunit E/Vma4